MGVADENGQEQDRRKRPSAATNPFYLTAPIGNTVQYASRSLLE